MKVGVIGCGSISESYLRNAPHFPGFEIVAVADLRAEAAQAAAARYGARALSVGELIGDAEVETVLNLTIPAAHAEISLAALAAGKHVYTEKPLAISRAEARGIVDAAQAAGLVLGSAPDTVLGPGVSTAKALLDAGRIGRPIAGTCAMMTRGMTAWHPSPDFFFKPGGGPVLDMGPYYIAMMTRLLGPVRAVTAAGTIGLPERIIEAPDSPRRGEAIRVETLTTVQGALEFAGGATVSFSFSWDVWRHGGRPLELFGEGGGLRLPDPNYFGGIVEVSDKAGAWQAIDASALPWGTPNFPWDAPVKSNWRGLGLQDMAEAVAEGRAPKASGAAAYHALDVLTAVLEAATEARRVEVASDLSSPDGGRAPRAEAAE